MVTYSREARERLWTEAARLARGGKPMGEMLREAAHVGGETANAASLLAKSVGEGKTLAEAVARHACLFALGDAEALAAAERTDRVPEALSMLAERAADDWRPRSLVSGVVLNFLLTLLASCAIIAVLLLSFEMFKEGVLEEMGVSLSAFSAATATLLGFELVLLLAVGGAMAVIQWLPDSLVRQWPRLGAMQTRVSPLGSVLRYALLSVWCDRMALFRRLGLGIEESVELSARGTGHGVAERVGDSLIRDMRAGASLAAAMEAQLFFPDTLIWSVYAGEEIGTTDHVWESASRVYQNEAHVRARVVLAVARVALGAAVVLACAAVVVGGIVLPFRSLMFF